MPGPKKIVVQKRQDGKFEGVRPRAARASVVRKTQREAVDASRRVLRKGGGGELAIRRIADGQIRKQDTIRPGKILVDHGDKARRRPRRPSGSR